MIENIAPKFSKKPIKVVGCGLAGAEVAFILANNGFDVHIFDKSFDRKKERFDYYDKYETYMIENMKYELECLNSPLLSIAKKYNFNNFGKEYEDEFFEIVKTELKNNPKIKLFDDTGIDTLSETETTIIATGHHTEKALLKELENFIGNLHVCFFNPEKMVLDAETVNLNKFCFLNNSECFVNLSEEEYNEIYKKIIEFDSQYEMEKDLQDEKQITVESMARRGQGGLRNAIFRPRFIENLQTQKEKPYASLKMIYNKAENVLILDDFYTALDEEEQKQILHSINLLKGCEIVRYCKIKRKTFLLAPVCLNENLQIKDHPNFYVCGGFVGTAGSFESLLMANYCAYQVISKLKGRLGTQLLQKKCCIGIILDKLLNKSVVNFRLINLNYDIIDTEDLERQNFDKQVEILKFLSRSQIEKFKEKFYGKYF